MTQADLAARTGLSTKHVNQIIKRGASVTADTAAQLEYATDVPAEVWAALDARHHALMARSRARMRLESALDWLDRFNLKELADRGVVPEAKRGVGTLEALLRFFGIADPDGWDRVWVPSITSFRRSPSFAPDATATTVWLRAGQRLANEIVTEPFDERALLDAMPELRRMTCAEPADALPELQKRMRGFGIALVYVAEFDGCRALWRDVVGNTIEGGCDVIQPRQAGGSFLVQLLPRDWARGVPRKTRHVPRSESQREWRRRPTTLE